jgi:flagellar motility protein MotE (MotC chaperone)
MNLEVEAYEGELRELRQRKDNDITSNHRYNRIRGIDNQGIEMIENWSSAKVNVYLEEKDKEIDQLHEEIRTLTEQRDDEEARVKVCVKFLRELLHPEYFGWAVTQEIREQARKTLINIGEFYETVGSETKIG